MKVVVIWFLVIDEWLHPAPLMRDLEALAVRGTQVTGIFPVVRGSPEIANRNFRIETIRIRRIIPIFPYLWFHLKAMAVFLKQHRDADVVILETDVIPLILYRLICSIGSGHKPRLAIREISVPVEVANISLLYHNLSHRLPLRLSRYSDAVFAISPMRVGEIEKSFSIPKHKLHVWPSSVDLELFNPAHYATDRITIRESLGIGQRHLLIYHGVLSVGRGLFELVEAMRKVYEERKDVVLLILGNGAAELQLKHLVTSSGLDGVVIFHKAVPHREVPRFIVAADVGMIPLPDQPQWRHQTPTKLLEYISMEKPVIITDIAAHREILGDSGLAFFCKQGRPNEIADAILQCLRSHRPVDDLDGRHIVQSFSPNVIADAILDILRHALIAAATTPGR